MYPKISPSVARWSSWKGNLVKTATYEYYAMCAAEIDGYGRKRTLKVNYSVVKRGVTYFECPAAQGGSRSRLNIISSLLEILYMPRFYHWRLLLNAACGWKKYYYTNLELLHIFCNLCILMLPNVIGITQIYPNQILSSNGQHPGEIRPQNIVFPSASEISVTVKIDFICFG